MSIDETQFRRLQVGDEHWIEANQGERPATVLAVIGPEALLEYVLPGGRSALRLVPANYPRGQRDVGFPYKNVSYQKLAKKWLLAMARDEVGWYASPQQARDLHKTPRQLFLEKWPEDEWKLYIPERG